MTPWFASFWLSYICLKEHCTKQNYITFVPPCLVKKKKKDKKKKKRSKPTQINSKWNCRVASQSCRVSITYRRISVFIFSPLLNREAARQRKHSRSSHEAATDPCMTSIQHRIVFYCVHQAVGIQGCTVSCWQESSLLYWAGLYCVLCEKCRRKGF